MKALPNGEAWLASVERADENVRHLSIHRGHSLEISNGHDALVDVSAAIINWRYLHEVHHVEASMGEMQRAFSALADGML